MKTGIIDTKIVGNAQYVLKSYTGLYAIEKYQPNKKTEVEKSFETETGARDYFNQLA